MEFFNTLHYGFMVGGNCNDKHAWWGSRARAPTPKGRQLYTAMREHNLIPLATIKPTYWLTDRRKVPDVIDFRVVKGIASNCLSIQSYIVNKVKRVTVENWRSKARHNIK